MRTQVRVAGLGRGLCSGGEGGSSCRHAWRRGGDGLALDLRWTSAGGSILHVVLGLSPWVQVSQNPRSQPRKRNIFLGEKGEWRRHKMTFPVESPTGF